MPGKTLLIPLEFWFSQSPKVALPLIALQYTELTIRVTLRPIHELYTINDIKNITDTQVSSGDFLQVAPNTNEPLHSIFNFQEPTKVENTVPTATQEWFADIHLIANYIFLDEAERTYMSINNHEFLIKQVREHNFLNTIAEGRNRLYSKNCVTNYMWRFRRNDVHKRNLWFNYTNWAYENRPPYSLVQDNVTNLFHTGDITDIIGNRKKIMNKMALYIGGVYRETEFNSEVYQYIDNFRKTIGSSKEGLYLYSFANDTSKTEYQPSGSMNMNKYTEIYMEF